MTKSIAIIDPENEQYDDLDIGLKEPSLRILSRSFYNELMDIYNDAKVGAILVVPLPNHVRFSNLKNILSGRGLTYEEDFYLTQMSHDLEGKKLPKTGRPAKLKKLSERKGKTVDIKWDTEEDESD